MTGVVDERRFAVIVGMSVVTTLVVPPLLRRLAASPTQTQELQRASPKPGSSG